MLRNIRNSEQFVEIEQFFRTSIKFSILDILRHIPAKTSLKSKNGTDYNQREHFQFNELRNIKLSK